MSKHPWGSADDRICNWPVDTRDRYKLICTSLRVSSIAAAFTAALSFSSVNAQERPPTVQADNSMANNMNGDGYLPPGIMLGQAGGWMFGYQFTTDSMAGNLEGTSSISDADILKRFAMTPTRMTMHMQMITAMYAPSRDFTVMLMLPYINKNMAHVSAMGAPFVERTEGFGDVQARGLYQLFDSQQSVHRVLVTGGVEFPTGSIDRTMGGMRLEYPMQLGSGTFSVVPGVTYLGESAPWSWGAAAESTVRLGLNSNGYRLGNRYRMNVWGARSLTEWLDVSLHVEAERWDNIHGMDPSLNPMDEPTKDIQLQAGRRLDMLLGASAHPTDGLFKGQQFFIEIGAPVYQRLNGPQLKRRWLSEVSWQWAF